MNSVQLLDMPAFFRAIERDLDRAADRILVETYIFRADRFARMVGERLIAAARRGVEVRLLFDGAGSREGDPAYLRALAEGGVKVRPYRKLPLRLGRLSLSVRDHSRLLVIDQAAYTGGYAFADPWLPADRGGHGWHDLSCRVAGPVVGDFTALFQRRWAEAIGPGPKDFDTGDRYPDVRLVADGPNGSPLIEDAYLAAFETARQRIWIANAYYYPSARFIAGLARAAERRVDVRMLLSERSTLPIVARSARAAYPAWLRAGLRVFEYLPAVLHAKVALVDDHWATVGTYNANPIAVRMSLELNVICSQGRLLGDLAAQLETDFARSREITRESLAGQSCGQRLGDRVAEIALKTAAVALALPSAFNRL